MKELILATTLFFNSTIGYQNPNNVSEFYTSGVGDKLIHQDYYPNTAFAVISIPFTFRSNRFNEPLNAGYYQLEPVIANDIPTVINIRQIGKVVGQVTVIDYKRTNYDRNKAFADIQMINNGRMAQITLQCYNYEIYGIIEMVNVVPE